MLALATAVSPAAERTESFDRDPNWDALNNRVATPRKIRQDFGYSGDGRIGGTITIAGEPAYYAKKIAPRSLNDELTASGTLVSGRDNGMALIGFFNADTAREWRTRNSLALRVLGRGSQFYVYEEYCTSRWRAGSNQFTGPGDKEREKEPGFASGDDQVHTWTLRYDPKGNDGGGTITAVVDGRQTVTNLDPGHRLDGATFTHFGLLNVIKHADDAGEVFIGDLMINGQKQDLSQDPEWEGFQNRREYETCDDRPYSDYGYSADTNYSGGKARGEMGGLTFRGDIRLPEGVNFYADRIELLNLEKPLKASGKLALRRAVQDSSTLIGFFHSPDSVTINPDSPRSPRSWTDYVPRNFFGVAIKGPTREGYFFHPTYRLNGDEGGGNPSNTIPNCPRIGPDGKSCDWSFEYDPTGAGGNGQIIVTLDGQSAMLDLPAGHKTAGARFNRFGIVSNWIDGNGQVVYFDDLWYTVRQE